SLFTNHICVGLLEPSAIDAPTKYASSRETTTGKRTWLPPLTCRFGSSASSTQTRLRRDDPTVASSSAATVRATGRAARSALKGKWRGSATNDLTAISLA